MLAIFQQQHPLRSIKVATESDDHRVLSTVLDMLVQYIRSRGSFLQNCGFLFSETHGVIMIIIYYCFNYMRRTINVEGIGEVISSHAFLF
jgi:hypothetical protein